MDKIEQLWKALPAPLRYAVYIMLILAFLTTVYNLWAGNPLIG